MKKYILGVIAIITCSLTTVSCLEDDDNSASASVTYYATCDTLRYLDINDTIYEPLIIESLNELKVAGYGSFFKESAEVNDNSIVMAIVKCNQQADATYKNLIGSITLEDIKHQIVKLHGDSLGLTSSSQLPLDMLTADFTLKSLNSANTADLKEYTQTFR